jgi:hypothetical protein
MPIDLSPEAAARLAAFVAEVGRLWPGAEVVEVRRLSRLYPVDGEAIQ